MKKHLIIGCFALLFLGLAFKDMVVMSSHPCAQDIQIYDACKDDGFSEKFCVIRSATQVEVAKSCLVQKTEETFTTQSRTDIEKYFSEPVVNTAPVREHVVTIALSPSKTKRKTIIHDFDQSVSKEGYKAMLQVVADLGGNETKLFGLIDTPSYEKEVAEYMIDALDAYEVQSVDNWSSYFATLDDGVNPNVFDVAIENSADLASFIEEMKQLDKEVKVYPVYIPVLYGTPNDPQQGSLWYLKGGNGVNAYEAWDQLSGTTLGAVQVGIVDDGVYISHEDLSIASASPAGAGGGHGTHVSGLVGALTNNSKGVASASRNIGNIQIKMYNYDFDPYPGYPDDDHDGSHNIMGLVQQAVQEGAKIINMSRGGGGYNAQEQSIFTAAYNQGVVLIAASGNEYQSQPGYPARYQHVISVGASNSNGSKANFSNAGADILSPGVSILSTCIGGGYCSHDGTSMASPLAASVAALLLSINGGLSPDQVESILKSTTNSKGVINACKAVAAVLNNGYVCTGSSGTTTAGTTTAGNTTVGSTTAGNTTAGNTTAGNTTAGNTTAGSTTNGSTTPGGTPDPIGICDDPPGVQTTSNKFPSQNISTPASSSVPLGTRVLEGGKFSPSSNAVPENKSGTRFLTMSTTSVNKVNVFSATPRSQVSVSLLSCNNGKKDADEADIDCGGVCPTLCSYADSCLGPSDCFTNYCAGYSGGVIGPGTGGGTGSSSTGMNETVRFEVTVSPNVLYPSQQANVVIKALNNMHLVNMQATNTYTVKLEGSLIGTIYIPASGTFTLSDYGVKFYEPGFSASQPGAYTLVVEDVQTPSIRGSMPITILGNGITTAGSTTAGSTTNGGVTAGGSSGGGQQPGCDTDADCKIDEYCSKTAVNEFAPATVGAQKRFLTMSRDQEEVLEKEVSITIDENVMYVKYKDNSTVYFTDFDATTTSKQEYVDALQKMNLSTIKELRSQDMSLATYRQFAQVRALSALQQIFLTASIQSFTRPLAIFPAYERGTNLYKIEAKPDQIDILVKKFAENTSVEYVEKGIMDVVYLQQVANVTVNDPHLDKQRHLRGKYKNAGGMNALEAWNIFENSGKPLANKTIYAVIDDTGVEPSHPDFVGKLELGQGDGQGHGTHVAGIIAAQANNATGVAGIAGNQPNVKIYSCKNCGVFSSVTKAKQLGAGIVNMSYYYPGVNDLPQAYKDAVNAAIQAGIVIVAAAGNDGKNLNQINRFPCEYGPIVCVASTTISNYKSSFSNYGSAVDFAAPGSAIVSTCIGGKYCTKSGTSMASPSGAGAISFLLSLGVTGAQAVQLLKETAVQVAGNQSGMGAGRIDLCNATAKFLGVGSCTNSFVPSPGGGGTSNNGTTTAGSTTNGGTTAGNGTGTGICLPKNGTTTAGTTTAGTTTAGTTTAGNTTAGNTTAGNTTAGNTTAGNTTAGNTTDGSTTDGGTTAGEYNQCEDGIKNGLETDVDCGGPYCPPCQKGEMCNGATDCVTNYCNTGTGGNTGGTGTYLCPDLGSHALGSKNLVFSDGTALSDIFGTKNQYVLIDVASEDCGPCLTEAAQLNANVNLKSILGVGGICGFVSVVDNAELSIWKNKVGGFVATNSKGYGNSTVDQNFPRDVIHAIATNLGLTINSIPRLALLKRDGTYASTNISLSQVSQYCSLCPFVENEVCTDLIDNDGDGSIDCADADCANDPACQLTGSEICNNQIDDDNDGFIDAFYSALDYNNDNKITVSDILQHTKVVQGLEQPVSGKIYDINNDSFVNSADALFLQQFILGITTGIEICNDGIDNDCNGFVDELDSKCFPVEAEPLCESIDIFDCDRNGIFSSGDVTYLQQQIVSNTQLPLLPLCDANGSNSLSTFDIVLLQKILLGMTDGIAQLKLFDYTNDGLFSQADIDRLNTSVIGQGTPLPCPLHRVCDIDGNGQISSIDAGLLLTILTSTDIGEQCGQGMGSTPSPTMVYCDVDQDSHMAKTSVSTDSNVTPHATLDSNGLYQYCTAQQCLVNISCQSNTGDDCDDTDSSITIPGTACVTSTGLPGLLNELCVCLPDEEPAPATENCANMLDDDGDGLVSCLDSDCVDAPVCNLLTAGGIESCNLLKIFDCNDSNSFTYDDIEALRKSILGITGPINLPICDANGSSSHSTLDLVLMSQILEGIVAMNSLPIFDYTQDGVFTIADTNFLWEVYYGIQSCPAGKICDINQQGGVNIFDLSALSRIAQNELTMCDIGCGNGTIDTGETCDDGNITPNDGCSSICLLEPISPPGGGQQQAPQEPEGNPTSFNTLGIRFITFISTVRQEAFQTAQSTTTKLYVSLFGSTSQPRDLEPVFMTASFKDRTFKRSCGNSWCDDTETPDSCPRDCGCSNGLLNPRWEQCDDGNTNDGDGCSSTCTKEGSGMMCQYYPGIIPPANNTNTVYPVEPNLPTTQCEKEIYYCLDTICAQYDIQPALCYQKCCANFPSCSSAVDMCTYRNN